MPPVFLPIDTELVLLFKAIFPSMFSISFVTVVFIPTPLPSSYIEETFIVLVDAHLVK